ncbi:glycosyltransferase family 2 protein [Caviibacterium pharyngocola]|uniref:Glycosyltransferase family 2 protein n=1 Tax=Caviibacterium pharyngocola TaxID=28159 RepID=A0A2M8RX97_9PAST|nr:glycosyltransferase family 2 protein [Caviibacterium pharyngocola]PJG83508.1 glycosyltransferase family 2 protein [Caviibacterium pharyngocola]
MKKIYIVILNYNTWKDTIECLESVLKSEYENYQIIVVDNKSPNNSMKFLLEWATGNVLAECQNKLLYNLSNPHISKPIEYKFYAEDDLYNDSALDLTKKVTFIQSNKNDGFASGNNLAIKFIQKESDFDYIWLLNNDTVIKFDSLSNLVSYADCHNIGICGSSLMYYHAPEKVQAYGGTVNKFFGTSSHILDRNLIEQELDYIVGASFLISKDVINSIGLLPEDYFLYYEETDYCFNAKKHDFKLGIALNSTVYHKEGGTTGASQNPNEKSEFSDILTFRNRVKFHKKYLGGGVGLWIGSAITIFNRFRRSQFKRAYLMLRSIIRGSN